MLPPLLKLPANGGCRPCNEPTGAVLSTWADREDVLTPEQYARIPRENRSSREECSICQQPLRGASPEVGESTEIIVAVDIAGACGHAFHTKCLQRWFDEQVRNAGALTCPLCRAPFLDRKIDEMYRRVNGVRPINPIPEVPGLLEDAENVAEPDQDRNRRLVLLEGTPHDTVIRIPENRRADWTVYAHDAFCRMWQIDPSRLTLNTFLRIIQLPTARERNTWLSYHLLVREFRVIAGQTWTPLAPFYGAYQFARYARNAIAQGASWSDVFMTVAFGRLG